MSQKCNTFLRTFVFEGVNGYNIDNDEKHQCSQATRMMNNLKAVVQKEKALVS